MIDSLEFLNRAALEFIDFPSSGNIYRRTAQLIHEFTGPSMVYVSRIDMDKMVLVNEAQTGMPEHIEKIINSLGKNPVGMEFPVTEDALEALRSGMLHELSGGVYDFTMGKFPETLCRYLESIFSIKGIYSIGFTREGKLYGNASIVLFKAGSLEGKHTVIELLARQAFLALQKKASDDRLRQAKAKAEAATQAKSKFVANVSHEIRTPLTAIIGGLDLMLQTEDDEGKREDLEFVRASAFLLKRILNDILDLSKIEAGKIKLERVSFNAAVILQETLSLFDFEACQKEIKTNLAIRRDFPCTITGDPVRFRQIITNIISNAIKFTAAGSIDITAEADRNSIKISVKDTGIGIPAEQLSCIFDDFEQVDSSAHSAANRYEGTGLGLTIVKLLTEMMGGTITVQSKLGQGSVFVLTLPQNLS